MVNCDEDEITTFIDVCSGRIDLFRYSNEVSPQSDTEFHGVLFSDFKSIKLCETLCYCGKLIHIPAERNEQEFHIHCNLLYDNTLDVPP